MSIIGTDARTLAKGAVFGAKRAERRLPGFDIYEVVYPPSLSISRHDHETAALCAVVGGAYEEFYGGRSEVHCPGSIVLHPAGEHHADEHGTQPVRLVIAEFEPIYIEALQRRLGIGELSTSANSAATRRLATRLHSELWADDPASELAIEAAVLDMVATVARAASSVSHGRPAWLGRVENMLHTAMLTPTLEALAIEAGVNPVHLSRTFRHHHGCTIAAFVRKLRIDRASAQIAKGTPLAEVAADLGYTDQSHFTREFRKATGTSPGRYRRERGAVLKA